MEFKPELQLATKNADPNDKRRNKLAAIFVILLLAVFYVLQILKSNFYHKEIEKENYYTLAKVLSVSRKGTSRIVYYVAGKEFKNSFGRGNGYNIAPGDYVLLHIYKQDPDHFFPMLDYKIPDCPEVERFQNKILDSIPNPTEDFCTYLKHIEFKWLVKNFEPVQFNSELRVTAENWPDFSKEQLIKITPYAAEKYLCAKDKKKMTSPSGSTYQYFVGQRINVADSITGLIYYRVGDDWIGYQLAFFNKYGDLKDELFLSGTHGLVDPEAQKEAVIFPDGKIVVTEILPDNRHDQKGTFKAQWIEAEYWVKPYGKIEPGIIRQFSKTIIKNKRMHNRYENAE